jgi:hypothetical protein
VRREIMSDVEKEGVDEAWGEQTKRNDGKFSREEKFLDRTNALSDDSPHQ